MNTDPTRYRLIDTKTGKTVGTYATAARARSERDRKDWQHGAMRYRIEMPKKPAADMALTAYYQDRATGHHAAKAP